MPNPNRPAAAFDIGFFRCIGFALLALTVLAGSITLDMTFKRDTLVAVEIAMNVTE